MVNAVRQVGQNKVPEESDATPKAAFLSNRKLFDLEAVLIQSLPKANSVSLSWNPGVPAPKSARDAIIGCIVYRSTKPHDKDAKPINVTLIAGTTFLDSDVEPGETYYDVTRAVTASHALSGPSNEAREEIPH